MTIAANLLAGDAIPRRFGGLRQVEENVVALGSSISMKTRGAIILVMIYTKPERTNVRPDEIDRGD